MSTFNLIIRKVVNLDNNIFSLNYNNLDSTECIYKFYFNMLYNNSVTNVYKTKFHFCMDIINNNFYFIQNSVVKVNFLFLFYKIQKTYRILNRFVYAYKYKKSKIIVNTDLQLNEIKLGDPNVICIYHINSKYLFTIQELLKLIYTYLTNNFSLFAEPISIKNPYNNIPFGKSILYNICNFLILNTQIKFIHNDHIDIFFKYKNSNFNITKFTNDYEYILREHSVTIYLNNLSKPTIKAQINLMIQYYNSITSIKKRIVISDDFDEDELIRIMKPYVHLRLTSLYSFIPKNKLDAHNQLIYKLKCFQRFNPLFGRKNLKREEMFINGKNSVKILVEFDSKHINFDMYEINDFMNNHLSYNPDQSYISNNLNNSENTYEDENDSQENAVVDILFNMNLVDTELDQEDELAEEDVEEDVEEQEEEYIDETDTNF